MKIHKIQWDREGKDRFVFVTTETYNEALKNFDFKEDDLPIIETLELVNLDWLVHN